MSFNNLNTKTVLVLMPDKNMGNVVVSMPAISALKEFYRKNDFFLVIDETYSEIVEHLIGTNYVLCFPRKEIKKNYLIERLSIFFRFIHQLRGISPNIAIDLQGGYASSILTYLSGAPLRVSRSTAKRAYLYNKKVKLSEGRHKVYNYTDIASAVGVHNIEIYYRLKAVDAKKLSLNKKLLDEGIIVDIPIACIHPGAGRFFRQWNSDGFAEISDWLYTEGFQVVFVGNSSDDLKKIYEINSMTKHTTYNLGSKLSLGELIALLEKSSLYIGNDSGPMHLAATAGIPVIALFGPGVDRRWRPLSDKAVVLRGTERCQKCKGRDCQFDFRCIKTLSPELVKIAIRKLLRYGAYDIIEKKF
jgi:ADP-heptose:LPS heptosyltransferase